MIMWDEETERQWLKFHEDEERKPIDLDPYVYRLAYALLIGSILTLFAVGLALLEVWYA